MFVLPLQNFTFKSYQEQFNWLRRLIWIVYVGLLMNMIECVRCIYCNMLDKMRDKPKKMYILRDEVEVMKDTSYLLFQIIIVWV